MAAFPFSSQYNRMVSDISTAILSRGLFYSEALHVLLGCMSSTTPSNMELNSVFKSLHAQRMCHEWDVDFLIEFMTILKQDDLHKLAVNYVQCIACVDVLDCRFNIEPLSDQLLLFTAHNCPSLTLGEAYEVKTILSNVLGLAKHMFWLHSSKGCAVLVWTFRAEMLQHVQAILEDKSSQSMLLSSDDMHHVTQIETLCYGANTCRVVLTTTAVGDFTQTNPSFSSTPLPDSSSTSLLSIAHHATPTTEDEVPSTSSHSYSQSEIKTVAIGECACKSVSLLWRGTEY